MDAHILSIRSLGSALVRVRPWVYTCFHFSWVFQLEASGYLPAMQSYEFPHISSVMRHWMDQGLVEDSPPGVKSHSNGARGWHPPCQARERTSIGTPGHQDQSYLVRCRCITCRSCFSAHPLEVCGLGDSQVFTLPPLPGRPPLRSASPSSLIHGFHRTPRLSCEASPHPPSQLTYSPGTVHGAGQCFALPPAPASPVSLVQISFIHSPFSSSYSITHTT